jgi:hypothetical protein
MLVMTDSAYLGAGRNRRPARPQGPRYLNAAGLRAAWVQSEIAARGGSLGDLGRAVGLGPGTARSAVSHWMNGDVGCNLEMVHKLAAALRCDVRDLLLPGLLAGAAPQTVRKVAESFGVTPADLPAVLDEEADAA